MRVRTCLIALGALAIAGALLIAAWSGGFAAPAHRFADKRPNATPVDVELAIAVDVSNSMDPKEQEVRRLVCVIISDYGNTDGIVCVGGAKNKFIKFRTTASAKPDAFAESTAFIGPWIKFFWPRS